MKVEESIGTNPIQELQDSSIFDLTKIISQYSVDQFFKIIYFFQGVYNDASSFTNVGYSINIYDTKTKLYDTGLYTTSRSIDTTQYVYLFGYPINITNPNGIFLLKLSQVQFVGEDQYASMFCGDVQFARLFCIIIAYYYKVKLDYSYNDIFNAFTMFYLKYYEVLPTAQISNISDDDYIKYTYTYDQYKITGTIDQICVQLLFQQEIQKQIQANVISFLYYALCKNYIVNSNYMGYNNLNMIVKRIYGFVIPSWDIYYYNYAKYLLNQTIYSNNQESTELSVLQTQTINSVALSIQNSKNINISIVQD